MLSRRMRLQQWRGSFLVGIGLKGGLVVGWQGGVSARCGAILGWKRVSPIVRYGLVLL